MCFNNSYTFVLSKDLSHLEYVFELNKSVQKYNYMRFSQPYRFNSSLIPVDHLLEMLEKIELCPICSLMMVVNDYYDMLNYVQGRIYRETDIHERFDYFSQLIGLYDENNLFAGEFDKLFNQVSWLQLMWQVQIDRVLSHYFDSCLSDVQINRFVYVLIVSLKALE